LPFPPGGLASPTRVGNGSRCAFIQPVFASAIEVYETLNPGAITRVSVRNLDGQLQDVWTGVDANDTCPAVLRIDFDELPFAVNSVRVELNTALVPGFNQLDAIKLIGVPVTDFEPLFIRYEGDAGIGAVASRLSSEDILAVFNVRTAADYDNDGWVDLIGRELDDPTGNLAHFALHNEGDGTFRFRGPFLPVPNNDISGGITAIDYDNDGDLDLFYPLSETIDGLARRNLLLRNDRGTFVDVTQAAGLTAERISNTAIWFDYDRDGWLDLYVGNWTWPKEEETPELIATRAAQQNILYRNQGDGTFAEVTAEVGLDVEWYLPEASLTGGTNFGFLAADFDDDGWTDLYVTVALSPNRLFFNREGRFVEEPATAQALGIVADSFGAAAGDIDNDGDLDLYQAAAFAQSASIAGSAVLPQRSTLFLNLGGGQFLDINEGAGLKALNAANTFFGNFFDYDNDGDVDLFTIGTPSFFENTGELFFVERPYQAGLPEGSSNITDFNGDGFVDVFGDNLPFRNRGNDNHYLTIDLVGTQSNRDGIGTQVFATTGSVRQRRDLMGGAGWLQDEPILHFGLGQATSVDQLEVRWPSGQVDFISAIPADQYIRIIEGRNEWYPAPRTIWEIPPPQRAVFGQQMQLDVVVRPALFEPSATFTRIVADLSGLGGPEEVPLTDLGDGTYRLQAEFVIGGDDPLREVEVLILQETSLGEYWTQLTRHVAVKGDPFTAVLEDFSAGRPDAFALQQNFPNPFNSGTVIRFALPSDQQVELAVYNLTGQQVATLVEGRRQAGSYAISWDGEDESGRALASGMYFYRLQAGEKVETRKLMLLR